MHKIDDKSVDMILCDLPYGTTACRWDTIIPFEPLWEHYKRIIKDNGAIVLTASQPFTTDLINSNRGWFRYEWIWDKIIGKQPFAAGIRPMKAHENVLVFYKKQPTFNAQYFYKKPYRDYRNNYKPKTEHYKNMKFKNIESADGKRQPVSVIGFLLSNFKGMHSTQKPVALFEYLIKTYTNEGETVLDNCAGSFTTAIACIKNNRNWTCIEQDAEYCRIGQKRIDDELRQGRLF
jgi:site-specific DNA-methyltransferase (adenine-specific)